MEFVESGGVVLHWKVIVVVVAVVVVAAFVVVVCCCLLLFVVVAAVAVVVAAVAVVVAAAVAAAAAAAAVVVNVLSSPPLFSCRWTATMRLESSEQILNSYLKPSVTTMDEFVANSSTNNSTDSSTDSSKVRSERAFNAYTLAKYYDHLYLGIVKRLSSEEWVAGIKVQREKR